MCFVMSFLTNTLADQVIQEKHATERTALHEYYEKHGGAPHH